MIVRPKPDIFRLFFINRGSIIGHIAPQLLAITIISMAVTCGARIYPEYFPDFTIAPFSILGLALSIFLGFRNNACYDRWWEARKQWGQLLVETRSAAREFVTLVASPDAEDQALRQRLLSCCIAFAAALAAQLRRQTPDVSPWLDPQDAAAVGSKRNVADAILRVGVAPRLTGHLGGLMGASELAGRAHPEPGMRMVVVVVVEPSGDLVKRGPGVRHGADAQVVALQGLHEGFAHAIALGASPPA